MEKDEYIIHDVKRKQDEKTDGIYFTNTNETSKKKGRCYVERSKEGVYDLACEGTTISLEDVSCEYSDNDSKKDFSKTKFILLLLLILVVLMTIGLISFGIHHIMHVNEQGK